MSFLSSLRSIISGSEIEEIDGWTVYFVPVRWGSDLGFMVNGNILYSIKIDQESKCIAISCSVNQFGMDYSSDHVKELIAHIDSGDVLHNIKNRIYVRDEKIHDYTNRERVLILSLNTYRIFYASNIKKKVKG